MLPLLHRPVRPPRPSFIGECVYASMWEALMERPVPEDELNWYDKHEPRPTALSVVLGRLEGPVQQRHATIVAGVVCWFGTNCGNSMLTRAKREAAAGRWESWHAYLMAWTLENVRRPSTNFGVRCIEHIQAPESTYITHVFSAGRDLSELPAIGADEIEAVEHLMLWIAEPPGQAFIALCEAEITRLLDEHSLAQRAAFLRENYTTTP